MPLPQNMPIDITPENVWAVLGAVESDFEYDLADVMADSDTEFVVEDEQKDNNNKDEDQEADTSIQTQINLYTQLYTTRLKITTMTFKIKKSMSPVMIRAVLLKAKMIPWKKFIGISLKGI